MKVNTRTLAGISVLSALVVVVDYTFKWSSLKLPFPWYPNLKFDFTGIPVVIAFLLYGPLPGAFTSLVASVAIFARSQQAISSSMKGLAEFSTILGMTIGQVLVKRFRVAGFLAFGISSRVIIMTCANFLLISIGVWALDPSFVGVPLIFALLLAAFNVVAGAISISVGYVIFEAVRRRVPSLVPKKVE